MLRTRAALLAILFALAARADLAPAGRPSTAPALPAGRFQTSLPRRSPLSRFDELASRFGWRIPDPPEPYDVTRETFEVCFPAKPAAATGKYGLLVWIKAGDDGEPPAAWLPVLEKRGLIWVAANRSGNGHKLDRRLGLAIDAAEHFRAAYPIDPDRVYVGGESGGGRSASLLAIGYPDVFRGGYFVVGVNYFRDVPSVDNPDEYWPSYFKKPRADRLDLARGRNRYVLLTGEKDDNRLMTKSTFERGYRPDGFAHATYIEVPGMGHDLPDAEWFEKGIAALEARE